MCQRLLVHNFFGMFFVMNEDAVVENLFKIVLQAH